MRAAIPEVTERRACRVLSVSRSSVRPRPARRARRVQVDPILVGRIRELIAQHSTFGYRRLWALLRYGEGIVVNRKAVYRVLKVKNWLV